MTAKTLSTERFECHLTPERKARLFKLAERWDMSAAKVVSRLIDNETDQPRVTLRFPAPPAK